MDVKTEPRLQMASYADEDDVDKYRVPKKRLRRERSVAHLSLYETSQAGLTTTNGDLASASAAAQRQRVASTLTLSSPGDTVEEVVSLKKEVTDEEEVNIDGTNPADKGVRDADVRDEDERERDVVKITVAEQHDFLPSLGSSKSRDTRDQGSGEVVCAWCNHMGPKAFTLLTMQGSKAFCSEICFTQCRRASFKKNKVCDWCKQVRPTVTYVDFQDGEQQLQFCGDNCLNQYKMSIFCQVTAEHLTSGEQMPSSSKNVSDVLITPELWMNSDPTTSMITSGMCQHSTSRHLQAPAPPPHTPSPPASKQPSPTSPHQDKASALTSPSSSLTAKPPRPNHTPPTNIKVPSHRNHSSSASVALRYHSQSREKSRSSGNSSSNGRSDCTKSDGRSKRAATNYPGEAEGGLWGKRVRADPGTVPASPALHLPPHLSPLLALHAARALPPFPLPPPFLHTLAMDMAALQGEGQAPPPPAPLLATPQYGVERVEHDANTYEDNASPIDVTSNQQQEVPAKPLPHTEAAVGCQAPPPITVLVPHPTFIPIPVPFPIPIPLLIPMDDEGNIRIPEKYKTGRGPGVVQPGADLAPMDLSPTASTLTTPITSTTSTLVTPTSSTLITPITPTTSTLITPNTSTFITSTTSTFVTPTTSTLIAPTTSTLITLTKSTDINTATQSGQTSANISTTKCDDCECESDSSAAQAIARTT